MNEDELRGKFLTKLRLEKNLTQSDLAKMIGYSDKSISKWERGKCFPKDIQTLIKLAEILDISIDDLLHLEYSDVEGKNTPHLNNKFLNFLFQNRKIFVIVFIIIILLFLGYLIFVIDFKSSNNILLNGGSDVEIINKSKSDNLGYKDEVTNEKIIDDISKEKTKFDRNKIHSILISEGFIYNQNIYSKKINYYSDFYFFMENHTFKIYDYSNDNYLYLLYNSNLFDETVVENYYSDKYVIEYIKNDKIKNCNLEKCESYLDYAMYINYIKKLILK